MFAVTLNTTTPACVTGYTVMSVVQYAAYAASHPNTKWVTHNDLTGTSLQDFIVNFYKYFIDTNGKLTPDTNM
jgi:hypothetical protein